MYTMVAEKLTKIGGGEPTPRAVLKLFKKIDNDEDWYPGKGAESRGRKPVLSGLAKGVVKRSAEAIKRRGGEPTYRGVCAACPVAVQNPDTGKRVGKKRVYDVFQTMCYDDGAEEPWKNRRRLSKTALSDHVIQQRLQWLTYMERLGHSEEWYYKHLIWIDVCNHIMPTTEKIAADQALARKAGRGWMSEGCQHFSKNLQGDKTKLKQNSE